MVKHVRELHHLVFYIFSTFLVSACPSSPTNTQIEMDVAPHQQKSSSEHLQYQYTRGIEIHQVSRENVYQNQTMRFLNTYT